MADISLDLSNPTLSTYKDLLILENDLVLTSDADPDGTQPVLQDILQRLSFFLGEWFMDNTQGLPWFQQILIKNPDQSKIDALFLNTIMGTPGVIQVNAYSFTVNSTQRILSVSFNALSTSGPINYTGTIANGSIGSVGAQAG